MVRRGGRMEPPRKPNDDDLLANFRSLIREQLAREAQQQAQANAEEEANDRAEAEAQRHLAHYGLPHPQRHFPLYGLPLPVEDEAPQPVVDEAPQPVVDEAPLPPLLPEVPELVAQPAMIEIHIPSPLDSDSESDSESDDEPESGGRRLRDLLKGAGLAHILEGGRGTTPVLRDFVNRTQEFFENNGFPLNPSRHLMDRYRNIMTSLEQLRRPRRALSLGFRSGTRNQREKVEIVRRFMMDLYDNTDQYLRTLNNPMRDAVMTDYHTEVLEPFLSKLDALEPPAEAVRPAPPAPAPAQQMVQNPMNQANAVVNPLNQVHWVDLAPRVRFSQVGIDIPVGSTDSVEMEDLEAGTEVLYTPDSAMRVLRTQLVRDTPGYASMETFIRHARHIGPNDPLPPPPEMVVGLVGSRRPRMRGV